MKNLTFFMLLISLTTCGQNIRTSEKMTPESWEKQSKLDKRLVPKYGHQKKTDSEKNADDKFIKTMVNHNNGDKRIASDYYIQGGFYFLNQNKFDTAMFRFNQAYLLDSTNTDIYWGFGGFFYSIRHFEKAKEQYEEGLTIDSTNSHLLTDLGVYYRKQYYDLHSTDSANAFEQLEIAFVLFRKSYKFDSNYPNTLYNLSLCYFIKGDCDNAWKYHDEYNALGGRKISNEYTEVLNQGCKKEQKSSLQLTVLKCILVGLLTSNIEMTIWFLMVMNVEIMYDMQKLQRLINYITFKLVADMRNLLPIVILLLLFGCNSNDRKVQNIESFCKIYGYARWFHPSDEAQKIDWDKFAILGVKKVEGVQSDAELKDSLISLFSPIVPGLQIYDTKEQNKVNYDALTPPDFSNNKLITWQHYGVNLSERSNIYKSVRTHRQQKESYSLINKMLFDLSSLKGKEVKLSGYFKTEQIDSKGKAYLYLLPLQENEVVKSPSSIVSKNSIEINSFEWKKYEIKSKIDNNTSYVALGCAVDNDINMWADNFELNVRSNGIPQYLIASYVGVKSQSLSRMRRIFMKGIS